MDDVKLEDLFGAEEFSDDSNASAPIQATSQLNKGSAVVGAQVWQDVNAMRLALPASTTTARMPVDARTATVRIPKTLAIDEQQWEPTAWDPSAEQSKLAAAGKTNPAGIDMVRWRVLDQQVQSNARVVQWTDGRYTLHVGTSVYDLLSTEQVSGQTGASAQLAVAAAAHELDSAGQPTGQAQSVLECVAPLQKQLVLRPAGASQASTKAMLAMRLAEAELAEQVGRRRQLTGKEDKAKRAKLFDELQRAQLEAYQARKGHDDANVRRLDDKVQQTLSEFLEHDADSGAEESDQELSLGVGAASSQRPSRAAANAGPQIESDSDVFSSEDDAPDFRGTDFDRTVAAPPGSVGVPERPAGAAVSSEDELQHESAERETSATHDGPPAAGVKRARVVESDSE